jgi:hypothetical protein
MNWMRQHVQRTRGPNYAQTVLARYRLGMKAGGAISGARILAGADCCPTCRALSDCVYDPDSAPIIPVAGCSAPGGCRCAYAPVMAYELGNWQLDHRQKRPEYAESVLARLRLAIRAGGAIGGVRIVSAEDCCLVCAGVAGQTYHPDVAPRIPIAECTTTEGCRCAYSTTMAYQVSGTNPSPR